MWVADWSRPREGQPREGLEGLLRLIGAPGRGSLARERERRERERERESERESERARERARPREKEKEPASRPTHPDDGACAGVPHPRLHRLQRRKHQAGEGRKTDTALHRAAPSCDAPRRRPLHGMQAQEDIARALGVMDEHLQSRTFLVGDAVRKPRPRPPSSRPSTRVVAAARLTPPRPLSQVTLADIVVSCSLLNATRPRPLPPLSSQRLRLAGGRLRRRSSWSLTRPSSPRSLPSSAGSRRETPCPCPPCPPPPGVPCGAGAAPPHPRRSLAAPAPGACHAPSFLP